MELFVLIECRKFFLTRRSARGRVVPFSSTATRSGRICDAPCGQRPEQPVSALNKLEIAPLFLRFFALIQAVQVAAINTNNSIHYTRVGSSNLVTNMLGKYAQKAPFGG